MQGVRAYITDSSDGLAKAVTDAVPMRAKGWPTVGFKKGTVTDTAQTLETIMSAAPPTTAILAVIYVMDFPIRYVPNSVTISVVPTTDLGIVVNAGYSDVIDCYVDLLNAKFFRDGGNDATMQVLYKGGATI